jgi:hypothetical protein
MWVAKIVIANRERTIHTSEFRTLLIIVHILPLTMAPYARWVLPSFREILVGACDEYLESNDRGTDKKRSKLITRIAKDLTDIAQEKGEQLPDDLEKVTMMACARSKSSLIFPVCPHLVW